MKKLRRTRDPFDVDRENTHTKQVNKYVITHRRTHANSRDNYLRYFLWFNN